MRRSLGFFITVLICILLLNLSFAGAPECDPLRLLDEEFPISDDLGEQSSKLFRFEDVVYHPRENNWVYLLAYKGISNAWLGLVVDEAGEAIEITHYAEMSEIVKGVQGAPITQEQSIEIAKHYVERNLISERSNPLYQEYCAYFSLPVLSLDEIGYEVSFELSASQNNSWIIDVYPIQANEELGYPQTVPHPVIRWISLYIDAATGEIVMHNNGSDDGMFRYGKNWFTEDDLAHYRECFSDCGYLLSDLISETDFWQVAVRGWPFWEFFPDMTRPQIVWNACSRYMFQFLYIFPQSPDLVVNYMESAARVLYADSDACEYGRLHAPEMYERLRSAYFEKQLSVPNKK